MLLPSDAWFLVLLKKVAIELNISTKMQLWLLQEIVLIWKPQTKYVWYIQYVFSQEERDYNYV